MEHLSVPKTFKGIALFTPGGDLVYCIDANKQSRWHLHLCAALQDWLGLSEPPHFLLPCYTATVDRWQDAHTGKVNTLATAAPGVIRYRVLLEALFGLEPQQWQTVQTTPELCTPRLLSTYRQQFPVLWECHDWVIRLDDTDRPSPIEPSHPIIPAPFSPSHSPTPHTPHPHTPHPHSSTLPLPTLPLPHSPIPHPTPSPTYVFHLYLSSRSGNVQRILQNLHTLLEQCIDQPYTLKMIDISKNPEQAELDQVTAMPTLVRVSPLPMRRIVGDLEDADRLLSLLSSP
ncbi:circadian clock KaiB family protein [Alkalinema sp. FACHB-956]|uniref:circadian clock KaiB family protein n=1 Tax=Alkalinema sp. FACHB-956 TaxID=2692768 RepID=UPI0016879B89|nr:circadian clock KaiB family protein [Alkalinema sp. FACHB-956]MBD2325628.1 circadian clock protein KaiB [Alkalinema sp. FACHB-956]